MPLTFLLPDGSARSVSGTPGDSLLRMALDQNIPLEAACGGRGFCTTCLCAVQAGAELLSPRTDCEANMGITRDPFRLACQARIAAEGEVSVRLLSP